MSKWVHWYGISAGSSKHIPFSHSFQDIISLKWNPYFLGIENEYSVVSTAQESIVLPIFRNPSVLFIF